MSTVLGKFKKRIKKNDDGSRKDKGPNELANVEQTIAFCVRKELTWPVLDLKKLLKYFDIEYQSRKLEDGLSGKMFYDDASNKWCIVIDESQAEARQRFTIAHEIGHYVLHRNITGSFEDDVFFRSNTTNTIEREANRFAGNLLMPKNEIARFFKECQSNSRNITIEAIAAHFGVSVLAARVRIDQLTQ